MSETSNTEVTPETNETEIAVEESMRRMSRRSFAWGGLAVAGTLLGWKWIASRRMDNGIPWVLREALQVNEQVSRELFRNTRLAPTFSPTLAKEPRPNGEEGLGKDFDPSKWELSIEGVYEKEEPVSVTLEQIRKMPSTEMVTELKCIEGWSEIVQWKGVKLSEIIKLYPPNTLSGNAPDVESHPENLMEYVGMETPDAVYYVGLDMESALHPQTLLCYEMNGQPLTSVHGAPLRLVIPVKYGIKNIKRIGTIRYASQRPADYWAERGYDWYAGH